MKNLLSIVFIFSAALLVNTSGQVASFNSPSTSCSGNLINFTNTSTSATAYEWDFGEPNDDTDTSTILHAAHTYNSAGTFVIRLIAKNGSNRDTVYHSVTVMDIGAPYLNVPDDSVCLGTVIKFSADVTLPFDSIIWDLGDGTKSTSMSPKHTYASAGDYTVSLQVYSACGMQSSSEDVRVASGSSARPKVNFNSPNELCKNKPVFLNGESSPVATSMLWRFGDGQTSASRNISHNYNDTGVFNITLIGTNACGTDSISAMISITDKMPPVTAFATNPSTTCPGTPVRFNYYGDIQDHVTSWDFGDGIKRTTDSGVIWHAFSSPGVYEVKVYAINECSNVTDSSSKFVTINNTTAPSVIFYSSTGSTCTGDTIAFFNYSSDTTVCAWDFGDGGTSSLANPKHVFTGNGSFDVKLRVTNKCSIMDSLTSNISIGGNTTIQSGSYPNKYLACPGEKINLNVYITGKEKLLMWDLGNGTTTTNPSPQVSFSTPGIYMPFAIIQNPCGYSEARGFAVTVHPGSNPVFQSAAAYPDVMCQGEVTTYYSNLTYSDSTKVDFGDGFVLNFRPGDNVPSHAYTTAGSFNIKSVVFSPCGNDTITTPVVVKPAPQANYTYSPPSPSYADTILFTNTSTGGALFYTWNFGTGDQSFAASPKYRFTTVSPKTVSLIAVSGNGCRDTMTKTFNVSWPVSVNKPGQQSSFKVYPNPAGDRFACQFNMEKAGAVNVEIVDVTGKKVYQHNAGWQLPGTVSLQFDNNMMNLSPGVYWLRVHTAGSSMIAPVSIKP